MHLSLRIGDTEIKDISKKLKKQLLTVTDGKREIKRK